MILDLMEDIQAAIEANPDDSFAAAQAVMDVVKDAAVDLPAFPSDVVLSHVDPMTGDVILASEAPPPSILVACLSGSNPS